MARKIRSVSPFSLSFLDIMSCGLGAAVLIFLLLKHTVDGPTPRDPQVMSEVSLLEEEIKEGELKLFRIRNTISEVTDETVVAQGLARQIQEDIDKLKSQLEEINPDAPVDTQALRDKIARLEKQKEALENTDVGGRKAYEFSGDGERQYLTGLRLGGERVLILLDNSASMLDESIVNIIRRRNMGDTQKKLAPKWQRATNIARWVIANLPPSSDFQILAFNSDVSAVFDSEVNRWHEVSDRAVLEQATNALTDLVPANGTNFDNVMRAAANMQPRPDNIFLITDGLPTLGSDGKKSGTISGRDRLRLFNKSLSLLPDGAAVNTMLLPLEGDTYAAAAFWRLAILTRGAFVTPARDWP